MASTFMKIQDTPGNATEVNHKEWIPLMSLSFGLHRTVNIGDISSEMRLTGKASFEHINVVTELSKASPLIARHIASGKIIPEILIDLCRAGPDAGDDLIPFLQYKLNHCVISSYNVQGGDDQVAMENISIGYTEIEWTYLGMDQKTGKKLDPVEFKWDTKEGKAK